MADNPHSTPRRRIVYVAPDCTDSAVQKRAYGFVAAGQELVSFSFRRARYNVKFEPDWPNIDLGRTTERRLVGRILMCLKALWVIFRNRRRWKEAQLLYVRNLDLAALSLIGKLLTRCRATLVYEVLDIHPALTQAGLRAVLLRWVERRVLQRSGLLVVSSPAFLRNYFRPVQSYRGATFLLENKWPYECVAGLSRRVPYALADDVPQWTIGWFGNIRCAESLGILTDLADVLPDRVRICIRGCVSLLGEDTLHEAIRDRANMVYHGEYTAPQDLATIYSNIHFNWCVDLSGHDNSLWLLPNRLYEGGYFGIPAVAIAAHETGRVVRERHLGVSFESPVARHLEDFFHRLTGEEYRALRGRIEDLPPSEFVDSGAIAALIREAPTSCDKRARPRQPAESVT